MNRKLVFTTGEVADLLHMHQTTVIDWVDKKLMPSYKTPGGHRRIPKESLLKFLADHEMPVPHVLTMPPSYQGDEESHRHLHESYQMGPLTKPMEAYPPFPKGGGVRNVNKKAKLAQKKV